MLAKVVNMAFPIIFIPLFTLDLVYPVLNFSYPTWRGIRRNKSGRVEFIRPENQNSISQDLEEIFCDAGQWYRCKVQKYVYLDTYRNEVIVLSNENVQDVVSEVDWRNAETKLKLRNS